VSSEEKGARNIGRKLTYYTNEYSAEFLSMALLNGIENRKY
jgi:hypothetical protein